MCLTYFVVHCSLVFWVCLPFFKFPLDYLCLGQNYFKPGVSKWWHFLKEESKEPREWCWSKFKQTTLAVVWSMLLSCLFASQAWKSRGCFYQALEPKTCSQAKHHKQLNRCAKAWLRWQMRSLQTAQNLHGSAAVGKCLRVNARRLSVVLKLLKPLWNKLKSL